MIDLPKDITHAGVFGTTGVGKSEEAEKYCEDQYLNYGKKIIDLTNDRFIEGVSWSHPTRIRYFRKNIKWARRKYKNFPKAKGLPTEIYHPLISNLPAKLPPNVKLYTLPPDFFSYEEVLKVLTNDSLSDASVTSLVQHIEKINDEESFSTIPAKIHEAVEKKTLKTRGLGGKVPLYFFFDSAQSASSANKPLLKMKNLGIISSRRFPYILNDERIKEMLYDRKTVSVFSTKFIDQRYYKIKLAINLYLTIKIRELSQGIGNVILYIREARNLFPHQRVSDRALKVLSELAESMAKDCRKAGIQLVLDTQTPWDLPDGVLDQLDLKFIFRHDRKISDIIEMYRGSRPLSDQMIKNIKALPRHRFYIAGADVPFHVNRPSGNKLDFKLTDHYNKGEDELKLMARVYPRREWKSTKNALKLLADDWSGAKKVTKQFERMHKKEQLTIMAKRIGVTLNSLYVMRYLRKEHEKNGQPTWIRLKDIMLGSGLVESSTKDALNRLYNNMGFVRQNEQTKKYQLTKRGVKWLSENSDIFSLFNK